MESKELDLEQIKEDLNLARAQRPDLSPLFLYVETLIAEVERLRGESAAKIGRDEIFARMNEQIERLESLKEEDESDYVSHKYYDGQIVGLERLRNSIQGIGK